MITKMKRTGSCFTFVIILLMFSYTGVSSHYGGGELTWKNIGTDSFLVTLTTYRDCNGMPAAASAAIKFTCNSNSSLITTITANYPSVLDITPICPSSCTRCNNLSCSFAYGIQQLVFQSLVVFNSSLSCCLIKISYDGDGSVSNSMTNIASGSVIYSYSILNRCLTPQDNSPEFSQPPLTILCSNVDAYINYGAYDEDLDSNGRISDSLSYEWTPTYSNSTTLVQYISPFSYDEPLHFSGFPTVTSPPPSGYHLNPATGDISFRPTAIEGTILSLKIKEFRNRIYIGEINRAYIILSILCPGSNKAPVLSSSGGTYYKSVCAGSNITFNLSTTDLNSSDTVFLSWNQVIPNASWTCNNKLTRLPTATFSWTPDDSDACGFPRTFVATATDNACPISASASKAFQIQVNIDVPVVPQTTNQGCGIFYLNAVPLKKYNLNYLWTITGGTISNSKSFIFKPDKPGVYPYTLQISGPGLCSKTYYGNIVTDTFLWGVDLPADTQICYGEKVNLKVKYYDPAGKVRFIWNTSINDTLPYKIFFLTKDTTIKVMIIDSFGCTGEDSIHIKIKNLPKITAYSDTTICYHFPLVLIAKGAIKYQWNSGDTTAVINVSPVNTMYYKVTGYSSNGCFSDDSVKVNVLTLPVADAGKDTSVCFGNSIKLRATGGGKYHWNTGDTNSIISVFPSHSGYYTVAVTGSNSCSKTDSVFVSLHNLPVANAGNDTLVCYGSSLTLIASGGNKYHWNTGGNTAIITVKPLIPQYYHVTVIDSDNCSSDDSVHVSIYPLPVANAGKDTLICSGQSILLTATGGVKYYWNTGQTNQSIQVSPVSDTYYSVKVIDGNQCSDYDSVLVRTKPLPKVRFGGNPLAGPAPLSVTFHDSSTITTGIINSWLWNFDDSTASTIASPPHIFLKYGYFNIKLVVTSNLGCKDSLIRFNYISTIPSDIPNLDNTPDITLIPNPAKSFMILMVKNDHKQIRSMSLLNSTGRTIRNYDFIFSGQNKIERTRLVDGIYYLKINLNDNHIIYKKLIFD